jgi:hypothetical protein
VSGEFLDPRHDADEPKRNNDYEIGEESFVKEAVVLFPK